MSYYLEPDCHVRDKVKVVLDLSNYATKTELEHTTGIDTSDLAAKKDFIVLKAEDDKLDINKLGNVPPGLNNLKTKVDDLDVGKLKTVPVDVKVTTTDYRKTKALIMFLIGNQREYIILNLSHYTAFLHSIKLSEYRNGIKFDKDPLAVEPNNYFSKIANIYIGYDLDAWPRNPTTNNFKSRNCLFEATSIMKNCDKENCLIMTLLEML